MFFNSDISNLSIQRTHDMNIRAIINTNLSNINLLKLETSRISRKVDIHVISTDTRMGKRDKVKTVN